MQSDLTIQSSADRLYSALTRLYLCKAQSANQWGDKGAAKACFEKAVECSEAIEGFTLSNVAINSVFAAHIRIFAL